MINFLRFRWLYLTISLSVLVPGVYSLVRWQLKPSIDFTGGTVIEIKNESASRRIKIKNMFVENQLEVISIENLTERMVIKTKPVEREKWEEVKKKLKEELGEIEEVRFGTVGPILGRELLQKTIYAATLAVFGILGYVAFAFHNLKYGLSAVIALFHDFLILTGIFSLLGHFWQVEVDILFVSALLTTMSFSVHDTIVVFDRIRESLREEVGASLEFLINKSLTETMSRSLNNSATVIFMLLALILLGGTTIKWFVVALLIGIISGTYSSPFVASPILYFLLKR